MRLRSFARHPGPACAVLAALAGGCGGGEPAAPPPSILVLTVDTLRADHLGAHGYPRPTSPNLDALAAESVVFERCLAPMAVTLPSHLSLFTGTHPVEHGVLANVRHGGRPFKMRPGMRTVAELAREAGYRTAAFVSATPVKRGTGVEAGFESFDEPRRHERPAERTLEAFYRWLEDAPEEPLFVWIHLFDPHAPYLARGGEPGALAADEALEGLLAARGAEPLWPTARGRRRGVATARQVSRYDREIGHVDARIGELRARLEARGLWQDLVVVFAGDHGEGLGQHGEPGHGDVWNEQLWTPLMLRVPGWSPRRVSEPVSLADALPTLLGRLDRERWAELLEQASGGDVLAAGRAARPVLSQRTGRRRADLEGPALGWTGPRWKLIHRPEGEDLLFDLERDPFELENLAAARPAQATALRDELLATVRRLAARRGPFDDGDGEETEAFDQKRLEELKALGYLD